MVKILALFVSLVVMFGAVFANSGAELQIGISAGSFTVVSVNVSTTLNAGQFGTATAVVRNDGTQASMDVYLTCTNGVSPTSGNPFRVSLVGTGQTQTASWQLSENIAQGQSVTYTCTAIAKDASDPSIVSNPITATGTAKGPPAPVCGNGICEPPTETSSTCPADCGTGQVFCTDGTAPDQCSYQKPLFCSNGQLINNTLCYQQTTGDNTPLLMGLCLGGLVVGGVVGAALLWAFFRFKSKKK